MKKQTSGLHLKKARLQEAHALSHPIAASAQYLIKNAIFLFFPLYSCIYFLIFSVF
jgi:hypothetical protein